MGFAAGLNAGSNLRQRWDARNEKEMGNTITAAATKLQSDSQSVDEEGNTIFKEATDFSDMSSGDIAKTIIDQVKFEGGKVDDQTWAMASRMGDFIQEKKNALSLFDEKKKNVELRGNAIRETIFNRQQENNRRNEKFQLLKSKTEKLVNNGTKTITGSATPPTYSSDSKEGPKDREVEVESEAQAYAKRMHIPISEARSHVKKKYKTPKKTTAQPKNPVRGQVSEDGKTIYDGTTWIPYK